MPLFSNGNLKYEPEYHSHLYFSSFAESLISNKHLRNLLTNIDAMVLNGEPPSTSSKFIMNQDDISLSPAATLGYELVKERLRGETSLGTPQGSSEKGVGIRPGIMGKSKSGNVSELKQIRAKIMDVFKTTLPSNILSEKVYPNIGFTTEPAALTSLTEKHNKIKANSVGFGDPEILKRFLLSNNNKTTGGGKSPPWQLEHTPAFFTSILENIDSILVSSWSHSYKREWKRYLSATPPPKPQSSGNLQQYAIKTERLLAQRDRVVKNITFVLERKPSTISLAHYASADWKTGPLTTKLDKKEIGRLEKLVSSFNTHNQQEVSSHIDLQQPASGGYPTYVNCFYCPPYCTSPSQKSSPQPRDVAFKDPSHADVNIQRLLVRTSLQDTLDHFVKFHSDRQSARVKGGHGMILPCYLCQRYVAEGKEEYRFSMMSCCLEDLRDHFFLVHSDDNLLFRLYTSIRKMIVQENILMDLKLVDTYFLSKCFLCGVNLSSQIAVKSHEKFCLSKFLSSCNFFGNRLTQDVFSCKYTKKKVEEEEHYHAINQASLFLKRASATTESSSVTTTATTPSTQATAKTTTRDQLTFEQYLSKKYGQFVIKRKSSSSSRKDLSRQKCKDSKKRSGEHKQSTPDNTAEAQRQKKTQNHPKKKKTLLEGEASSKKWRKMNPGKAFIDSEAIEDNRHLPGNDADDGDLSRKKNLKSRKRNFEEDKKREVIHNDGENGKEGRKEGQQSKRPRREEEKTRGSENQRAPEKEEKRSSHRKEEEKDKSSKKKNDDDNDNKNDDRCIIINEDDDATVNYGDMTGGGRIINHRIIDCGNEEGNGAGHEDNNANINDKNDNVNVKDDDDGDGNGNERDDDSNGSDGDDADDDGDGDGDDDAADSNSGEENEDDDNGEDDDDSGENDDDSDDDDDSDNNDDADNSGDSDDDNGDSGRENSDDDRDENEDSGDDENESGDDNDGGNNNDDDDDDDDNDDDDDDDDDNQDDDDNHDNKKKVKKPKTKRARYRVDSSDNNSSNNAESSGDDSEGQDDVISTPSMIDTMSSSPTSTGRLKMKQKLKRPHSTVKDGGKQHKPGTKMRKMSKLSKTSSVRPSSSPSSSSYTSSSASSPHSSSRKHKKTKKHKEK